MKAEELMIGDWVLVDRYHPMRITKLSQYGEYPDCEPIPLTHEILEKNFPSINGLAWWPQDDAFHCESRTNGDIMVSGQFRYVHQLQQALRLVGIEKEIVL